MPCNHLNHRQSEWLLTTIINSISGYDSDFVLVLDDYHNIESPAIHEAVSFLIEHLPPQVHLVIASRIDPPLPLARWRVKGELTEIRAADLRFTPAEAAEFLNQVMGLNLSAEDIAALENRTEGWIAGLQLAAIALQGDKDTASFIKSFTGSHHFVLDYLLEEVLQKQSESVQTFLLRTSILGRLCGPLCDAVLLDPSVSGQETLEYLEHANLFIVPLDNERRWYRYHHLFADLLRQRLLQSTASSAGDEGKGVAELHKRASAWYEDHGLDIEAFQHAAAANDIERAERLIDGKGMSTALSRAGRLHTGLAGRSLPETADRLREMARDLEPDDFLFVAQQTRHGRRAPLGEDGMSQLIGRLLERAGIKGFTGHDLRRTFATLVTTASHDEFLAMRLIRDRVPGLSERYIRYPMAQLVEALQKYSPVRQAGEHPLKSNTVVEDNQTAPVTVKPTEVWRL